MLSVAQMAQLELPDSKRMKSGYAGTLMVGISNLHLLIDSVKIFRVLMQFDQSTLLSDGTLTFFFVQLLGLKNLTSLTQLLILVITIVSLKMENKDYTNRIEASCQLINSFTVTLTKSIIMNGISHRVIRIRIKINLTRAQSTLRREKLGR